MKITASRVYDLWESIVASGLPMMSQYDEKEFERQVEELKTSENQLESHQVRRAISLAQNPPGTGHNNFLSGILFSANVTGTIKWWEQFQRYHFKQIVSSQSTMHRLEAMLDDLDHNRVEVRKLFSENVSVEIVACLVELYRSKKLNIEQLSACCPCGLELTARITTNYLQLKTMVGQRQNHKLKEWRDFVSLTADLPLAPFLIFSIKKS